MSQIYIKKHYLCIDILYLSKTLIASRPVVKLHGFFFFFLVAKKTKFKRKITNF